MKIGFVIPAYNEEKTIGNVIREIKIQYPESKVFVIDDASIDNTKRVVLDLCIKLSGIVLLSHSSNLGGGAAVKTGIQAALNHDIDCLIQVDGDGQHNPQEVSKLLRLIEQGADLALGSRYSGETGYETTLLRFFGVKFVSMLASLLTGVQITDINTGFKAMNRRCMESWANNYPARHPSFEATVRFIREGGRVSETPVKVERRFYGKSEFTLKRFTLYPLRLFLSILKIYFPRGRRNV
jgi:hypothetical protein